MWLRAGAAICIAIAIVTTLTINATINNLTAKWQITNNFEKWSQMRTRWHLFQGLRGRTFPCLVYSSIYCKHFAVIFLRDRQNYLNKNMEMLSKQTTRVI